MNLRLAALLVFALLPATAGRAAVRPASVATGTKQFAVALAGDAVQNTAAIQNALDEAGIAGGVVRIPAGRWLCGPLRIHSRTELRLDSAAVLVLRSDVDGYPSQDERYLNFLSIDTKASDVRITGRGIIDGQGAIWWERFTAKTIVMRRPQVLFAQGVQRLEISELTFLDPPNTHISLKDCIEVLIRDIRIEAPEKSRNTDGINISARNCLIENCDIATGDDNIAINFGGKGFTEAAPECGNIEIRNCRFGHGHGLSIGSYTSGNLRGLDVHDCRFEGTTSAIRIKSARGRGGLIENLSYRNIVITGSKWPVFISAYYPKEPVAAETAPEPVTPLTPRYRNLTFSNISVTGADEALRVFGLPEQAISGLQFKDCTFTAKRGMTISHATDIRFEDCKLDVASGPRLRTENARVDGLSN